MRRKDREVTDKKEIFEILERCNTVRIGMYGGEYPYIVPVSFGVELIDDKPVIYFHCAKQGLKLELLRENSNVCVEGDTFMGIKKTEHGITTKYESIIGFGKCVFVEDEDEIIKGLSLVLEHYGHAGYNIDRCKGLNNLNVCKIILDSIYGKQSRPE